MYVAKKVRASDPDKRGVSFIFGRISLVVDLASSGLTLDFDLAISSRGATILNNAFAILAPWNPKRSNGRRPHLSMVSMRSIEKIYFTGCMELRIEVVARKQWRPAICSCAMLAIGLKVRRRASDLQVTGEARGAPLPLNVRSCMPRLATRVTDLPSSRLAPEAGYTTALTCVNINTSKRASLHGLDFMVSL